MAKGKTNAMRILDSAKIPYEMMSYEVKDGKIDGVSVANKIGRNPEIVYKTLVAQGTSKNVYVFVIPVEEELNLKKAASVAGEKKVEMVAVKDIQKLTGYIRGGCSPVGMSKKYPTFIQEDALGQETIIVSGGKIGMQIEIEAEQLAHILIAKFVDIVH
ncbi:MULTISPECIES: Cys-tRNA(Pro) deacylase [Bacillus]|uniref:Cys-tRNA(Pro) deacylase n=1 Tax=Bacillus TaxID=1386 RepID=UPI0002F0852F|nr:MULTISPECIES: Cys-tRNA(Pro) deacylase [Bacillus]